MTDFPPMKAIVAFEVVARNASFGKAAEELNLTISAVSHQIATLEEYVGRQLFVRSPRGVTLTAAGERYRQSLSGALAIIADATQTARTETGTEVLRVHSSPSFARLWLMPRLSRFRSAHP
jgi:LysR family glycine cleavage system transcriptional activator